MDKNAKNKQEQQNEEKHIEETNESLEEEKNEDGQEIEELESKIEEFENNWKRAVADYRNLEKRVAEERSELIKFANRDFILRLLPAFDTLFLAERYIQDEGLKVTIKHLANVLKDEGIERIETVGKKFDPQLMEVVQTVEGDDDKVIEETRPGFTFHNKLLRPAQVKVGKKNE